MPSVAPPGAASTVGLHGMRIGLLTLLSLLAAAGCSTDKVTYRLGGEPTSRSRAEAERVHATQAAAATASGQLDAPLKAIEMPFPEYPKGLRQADVVGRVRVRFVIEADGTVGHVRVVGSAPPALADLTLQSIKRWRFEPPRRGGRPTRVGVEQEFGFDLE